MLSRDKEYQDLVQVAVLVTLTDRSTVTGILNRPRSKTLTEYMNQDAAFLEIERRDGSKVNVAKHAIRSIETHDAPRANHLSAELDKFEKFEPHEVLGVAKGAARESVREAYLRLQRLYHPDRYTGTELPPEVADYIGAVARRINIAYAMLSERGRAAN
jgi:DnaJ-domain-containing protein 1